MNTRGTCRALGPVLLGILILSGCAVPLELEVPTEKTKHNPLEGRDLNDVYMTNNTEGFIVGSGGLLLRTRHGGDFWMEEFSGAEETLRYVRFDSRGEHGWIVGSGGTILHSMNRGASWIPEISGTTVTLRAISEPVYDPTTHHFLLWVVGDEGTILYSDNSGINWFRQESTTINNLRAVSVTGSGFSISGWAFGDGGMILRMQSNNGLWMPQVGPTGQNLYATYLKSASEAWVVGDRGTVLQRKGSETWVSKPTIAREKLTDIFFSKKNPKCGWIVGERGRVLQTDDGGDLWLPRDLGAPVNLLGIFFIMPEDPIICHDIGWVVGENGSLFHSIDGGIFWREQTIRLLN